MNWGTGITSLGTTTLKEKAVSFGIKDEDRLRHLCVLGKVGSGRGEFIAHMGFQDIERGIGTVILDASGNVAPYMVERFDESLADRLVYLDPADAERPYAWNILDDVRALPREAQVDHVTHVLEAAYERYNDRLIELVAPELIKKDEATVITFFQLVIDEAFRKKFYEGNDDGLAILESFLEENGSVIEEIEERGRYIAKDTLVRNVLGQSESKFSLTELAQGKVVIVDLSRIRMFPTRMTPIVRMFVEGALIAGTHAAQPVSLYLHDALRYLGDVEIERTFNSRSVALTVADTVIQEEDKERREQALARCGSVASFTFHPLDRPLIERAFYPYVEPEEFNELDERELVIALTIDAARTRPFFGKALPLERQRNISYQDLVDACKTKYTTSRIQVDALYKKDDGKKGGKKGPGGFQDAFKSMFEKRAKAGAAGGPDVKKPNGEKKEAATPAPKKEAGTARAAPREVSEDTLKNMLYVKPVTP